VTPARDRLVLVLDVGGLTDARALARRLAPWFGTVKVGVELYAEAGPEAFDSFHADGFRVFADMKLHDIPNTVARAARVFGRRGVDFLNFHAVGGREMLRGGVEALRDGAREGGHAPPIALGVTVLTSDSDARAVPERLDLCMDAGCDGVVCSAWEVDLARERGLRTMVPGIRRSGDPVGDQARVATPSEAIARGADWLVIGRSVTAADDPEAAAVAITAEVDAVLSHEERTSSERVSRASEPEVR
jgi:orotidine-5'-phosphate decarboxylase